MKKIIICIASFFSTIIHACPTCVGKTTSQTVPFFAEEFYKAGKQNNNQTSTVEYGKKELQKLIDDHKEKK
jgi:hypothetical protein